MNQEEKFYTYLSDFQEDIKKLINYRRRSNHLMSVEEIASDLNMSLLKKKDKIINFKNESFHEFSFESFKFQVCSYIKNAVTWFHCRKKQEKFYCRRDDFKARTEDGEKSSFEIVSQKTGVETDFDFDKNSKHKYFLKLIKKYSDYLTKNEVELLGHMLDGKKQIEMAEHMAVTHQAISFNIIRLEEKLKCRIKYNFLEDESWRKITVGKKAIQELFNNEKG